MDIIKTSGPKPQEGDTIAVWFSCGAASAVAAKKTIEKYPHCKIRVVNNPIEEEDSDNQRFLKDVEEWLGHTIEFAENSKYPDASCETVWEHRKYMSGVAGAPCTQELKKGARQEWENTNHHDWIVLGFTKEEEKRHKRFSVTERDTVLPVLIEDGVTKDDCYKIISDAGIELPYIYYLGYPNANCIGCVKSQSPTYWNHVRKVHPEIFERRAEMSRRLGARLVKLAPKKQPWLYHDGVGWVDTRDGSVRYEYVEDGEGNTVVKHHSVDRIYLDELPEDAIGAPLKSMDVECGIFCEEKP